MLSHKHAYKEACNAARDHGEALQACAVAEAARTAQRESDERHQAADAELAALKEQLAAERDQLRQALMCARCPLQGVQLCRLWLQLAGPE